MYAHPYIFSPSITPRGLGPFADNDCRTTCKNIKRYVRRQNEVEVWTGQRGGIYNCTWRPLVDNLKIVCRVQGH